MEICDLPITDYLDLCLKTAEQRGFLWVMILLARERDIPDEYAKIKRYWNSYDDLTGDNILFLLTTSNDPREHVENILIHEREGYKRIGNSSLLILNSKPLHISEKDYPANALNYWIREKALENMSLHITPLLQKFKLSESDIPAILLIPTMKDSSPVILRKTNNVYLSLRSLIIYLETLLREFDDCKCQMANKYLEITETDKAIQANNLKITDKQKNKYLQSKEYVDNFLKEIDSDSRESLKSAINNRDLSVCARFKQPIRAHLNRLIDMQTKIRLSEKKKRLDCEYEGMVNNLFSLRKKIYKAAEEYCNKTSYEGEDYVNTNNKKYKIGVTFTGKNRKSIVEPVCEKLIERFGFAERELFYDDWHTEEIAGIHADNILKEIYSDNCECIVVFLSDDYNTKHWTNNVEWEAIKTMINTEDERRILLLNVDSVNIDTIEGLNGERDIFIDISQENIDQIARRINRFYSNRIEHQ